MTQRREKDEVDRGNRNRREQWGRLAGEQGAEEAEKESTICACEQNWELNM